jgi:histidyl-tRNA synthetase
VLPSLEPAVIYVDKAGAEVLGQMYAFTDRKGRELCLRPEGTATCQLLARGPLARQRDVRLWYETKCWRYEQPQAGRYREFTQFGVEILNPRRDLRGDLVELGARLVRRFDPEAIVCAQVKRGLAYYSEDGFEVLSPRLGAQQQVLGGGRYPEGIGFAIGVDRLALAARE